LFKVNFDNVLIITNQKAPTRHGGGFRATSRSFQKELSSQPLSWTQKIYVQKRSREES